MINIEHIAVWTHHLERLKDFYQTHFQAVVGAKYNNPYSGFESYFLTFSSGARLELMAMPGIPPSQNDPGPQFTGYIHLALSTGSEREVVSLTESLRAAGSIVLEEPRRTGDGYYESVVLDPDGNRIEITI
jgi:lactoylglutathione lyase